MNEKEGNCVSLAKSYFIDMLFGKKKDVGSGIQMSGIDTLGLTE